MAVGEVAAQAEARGIQSAVMADTRSGFMARQSERLGVSVEFLEGLLQAEDWAKIIQLHALVETALTDLLIRDLDRPEIAQNIRRMTIATKLAGR